MCSDCDEDECWGCRLQGVIALVQEPTRIPQTDAKKMGLTSEELGRLSFITRPNPRDSRFSPMKLYMKSEVQALANRKRNGEHIAPQPVQSSPERRGRKITKTTARSEYGLTDAELATVPYETKPNPHGGSAPMRLYLEADVKKRAERLHGGAERHRNFMQVKQQKRAYRKRPY